MVLTIKRKVAPRRRVVGARRQSKGGRLITRKKKGGFFPLIPLLAGLSAIGSIAGGSAGIAKAVIDSKNARKEAEELARHNKKMESIAMSGKKGSGIGDLLGNLSPLFTAGSGAAGLVKAVMNVQANKKKFAEMKRHNDAMEALAMGRGLKLKPWPQRGRGLKRPKNGRRR